MTGSVTGASAGDELIITGFETRLVSLSLPEPVRTSIHTATHCSHALLRLHAGKFSGIGHVFAFSRRQAAALELLIADLAEFAVGSDANRPEALFERMYEQITFAGHRGLAMMALSAVDTACWDLRARRAGLPLWALLGGARRTLSCYASDTLWLADSLETIAVQARRRVGAGFGAVKVRIGSHDPARDRARVEAVMEAAGDGVLVMADANQGWSREEAVRTAVELRDTGLHWLEEPVDADDFAGLQAVADASGLPIATGESWYGQLDVEPGLATGAVTYFMPDLQRIGGVTGFLRSVATARERGALVSPHLFPEVAAQLLCAIRNPHLIEYVPWFAGLFDQPLSPREGRLQPADRPGLGVDFAAAVFPA